MPYRSLQSDPTVRQIYYSASDVHLHNVLTSNANVTRRRLVRQCWAENALAAFSISSSFGRHAHTHTHTQDEHRSSWNHGSSETDSRTANKRALRHGSAHMSAAEVPLQSVCPSPVRNNWPWSPTGSLTFRTCLLCKHASCIALDYTR